MKIEWFELDVVADSRLGCIDLTEEVFRAVKDSGVTSGVVLCFCRHTTCGLLLNEWEDGALEDLRMRLDALVPGDEYYRHDDRARRTQNLQGDDEPANGQAHVIHMLLGASSHVVPIEDGEPSFGRWQRLFLIELDEPRPRTVRFQVLGI